MRHSNVSPSRAEQFFLCPGSVNAQAAIDTIEPSNSAALEGIAIHILAAECLSQDKDPYECIGSTIEVKDNYNETIEFIVDDDLAFAAKLYKDTIYGILREHGLNVKALQIEAAFSIPEVDPLAHGTTDCSFLASDTLYVFDLKGGRGIIVDPVENRQAMYYALRPYLDAKMFIKRIMIGIIQPRAKEGELIKMWETTPERLEQFKTELQIAIGRTREKHPEFHSGSWCRFCRAQGTCSVIQNSILTEMQDTLPKIRDIFPKITELTAQQIGKALPVLEILKGFIENLEGYAFTLALKGDDIPNYTLTRGKKQRKYKDETAVIDRFEPELGETIYAERKLRTPAQLEKLVGKGELDEFVFVPEGDLKLIPTKEAVEFIKRNVDEVFKDVQLP